MRVDTGYRWWKGLRGGLLVAVAAAVFSAGAPAEQVIELTEPMSPPEWALLERAVLRAGSEAVERFYDRYFDQRGYLEHVARWGILDGTDDAIETFHNWTLFHAVGASDLVLDRYRQALEGHLRQYSQVKTTTTDIARNGVYHREFYGYTDWLHAAEGLRGFFFQGLADPADARYVERMRRFAGLYMNEDPAAPNYDPKHRIIRSVLNGSRGPLLRELTREDWIGDPVPGLFHLLHSEKGDQTMLDFEAEYPSMLDAVNDPVFRSAAGDNPLNLAVTNLATAAYMLTGETKYRDWTLEYANAWRERTEANGGIIPGNIGLDGTIGGAYGGKWYKGIFMWDRERYEGSLASWGMWPGFGNAYLLTGDRKWIDALRRQIDLVYAQGREVNGRFMTPNNYGDKGWYRLREYTFTHELAKIWTWTMEPRDRERLPAEGWIAFLSGSDPGYPERALRRELQFIRQRAEQSRRDPTTPDSRLADWPLQHNPVTARALVELAFGGHRIDNALDRLFGVLHCRVRHFDPERRRPGLPEDVAALVTSMDARSASLTLVNTNQIEARTVIVQGGAYGEHQIREVEAAGRKYAVNRRYFTVRLAPGAGAQLLIRDSRYANQPTMAMPWFGETPPARWAD
ncbi:MAG: hypothetical protein KIT09_10640 [Bryobacteraceae bacterium]|nr:hypothetical protein [Bryobacteraceae bacterium]